MPTIRHAVLFARRLLDMLELDHHQRENLGCATRTKVLMEVGQIGAKIENV